MSTALVTSLRESCGYLRDGGYHQTATLMMAAASEIERLNHRIHALEVPNQGAALQRPTTSRRSRPTAPLAGA